MDRWLGKVAIVTGAAAGIGFATTEMLLDLGVQVVGADFNKDTLTELKKKFHGKKGKLHTVHVDMRNENDILNMFMWINKNVGAIHILINCAGIFRFDSLADGKTESWKDVFDTNVVGLCIATREAVRDMRANNTDGHIIHISSIAGRKVSNSPDSNVYSASKHAVGALAETLKNEFISHGDKIKISTINPGLVKSELLSSCVKNSGLTEPPDFYKGVFEKPFLNPKDIADAIKLVLSTPPHVQIYDLTIQAVGDVW